MAVMIWNNRTLFNFFCNRNGVGLCRVCHFICDKKARKSREHERRKVGVGRGLCEK